MRITPRVLYGRIRSTDCGRAIGLAAALLALAWALPAAAAGGQWPQVGYNAGHTGYNGTERVINATNVTTLAATGTYQTGAQLLSSVISKGILYGWSYDQNLYAWNLATGKKVWSIPLATEDAPSVMAISGSRLLTSCVTGANQAGLCGHSAKTGKLLWTYGAGNEGQIFAPPAISGTTVYFPTSYMEVQNSNILVAADVTTGAQIWSFGSCGNECVTVGDSSPAVDGGMVYFGCRGGGGSIITVTGVCAVNASTGAYVWQTQLGCTCSGDGRGYLTAHGGTVYVAYRSAFCYQCDYTLDVTALNGSTGAVLWDTAMTPAGLQYDIVGPPALGPNGSVYAGINTSNNPNQNDQFAFNGANGSILWQVNSYPPINSSPTIVGKGKNSVLFFTCSNEPGPTCALDASTGSLVWTSSGGGPPTYDSVAPMVTGGAVYNFCGTDICSWAPP